MTGRRSSKKKPAAKRSARKKKAPAAATAAVPLVEQPHGGALLAGGVPGNRGGTGRPPNDVREKLKGVVEEGVGVVADILQGRPVQKLRVSIAALTPHIVCANCGEQQITPKDKDSGAVEIEATASASPKDRISAFDAAAKYSLGQKVEVTLVSDEVKDRVSATLAVIRDELPGMIRAAPADPDAVAERLVNRLDEVWI